MAPDFQDLFHEQYFRIILPLLDDKAPRVVAHCLASLTNFLEQCKPDYILPHFELLYKKIMIYLDQGISFVKEACLSALSALAEGAEKLFEPFYNDVMKLIFVIFEQSHQPIFKQLVGISVECITIIAKIFGK